MRENHPFLNGWELGVTPMTQETSIWHQGITRICYARWFDSPLLQVVPSKGVVLCMIIFSRCATCTAQWCSSPVDHTSVCTNHSITGTYQPPNAGSPDTKVIPTCRGLPPRSTGGLQLASALVETCQMLSQMKRQWMDLREIYTENHSL